MIGWIAVTERDDYSTTVVRVAAALIGCFVALPGLVACSAQLTSEADAEATQLTALVEVDRSVRNAADPGHGGAIARFVRIHAGDDGALGLVSSAEVPAIGTCASGLADAASAKKPVELLNVGNVVIEGSGVRTTLVARRLPDVVDLISGVVYTARGPEEGAFGAGKYVVHVAGAAEVPAFVREADAPSAPNVLRVADQDPSSSVVVGGAAEIAWEPGAERDVIVVETTGGSNLRCTFADNAGRGVLPAASFGAQGTLTVHRVHREAFTTPGVDRGEVRFDFARVISYTRR
jgi:hypothetical protein